LSTFLDPLTYFQAIRLLHFYGYSHVRPRRRVTMGETATLAPNVSIRNGERIFIGAGTKVGEHAYLWAGDTSARITIGEECRLGPEVFVTASDYGLLPDQPIAYQPRNERDVVIGDDVWLGARVFVGAGVTIGDGCVVSAGSVVTKSLPPRSIAVGIPARIVRRREDYGSQPQESGAQVETNA
jgi:acetyltransferase-like isoleucine patch superfamily enzyme